jgi:uncharacterized membrane protein
VIYSLEVCIRNSTIPSEPLIICFPFTHKVKNSTNYAKSRTAPAMNVGGPVNPIQVDVFKQNNFSVSNNKSSV